MPPRLAPWPSHPGGPLLHGTGHWLHCPPHPDCAVRGVPGRRLSCSSAWGSRCMRPSLRRGLQPGMPPGLPKAEPGCSAAAAALTPATARPAPPHLKSPFSIYLTCSLPSRSSLMPPLRPPPTRRGTAASGCWPRWATEVSRQPAPCCACFGHKHAGRRLKGSTSCSRSSWHYVRCSG